MSRPPEVDEHGVEHRYGCDRPGWTSKPSHVPGIHILRCPTCGAVRLVQAAHPQAPRL
jgi:hypothetical protein